MSSRSDLTALLEHTGWVRALARSLASDAHAAEDLAQDAWVRALERPPEPGRPVRGWLATVLRHRWLDTERRRRRRAARERAAAHGEATPSSHDVVEKAWVQRRLVEAVLELDEPYRTTVLLRFFEGLPQREIAARMQTTPATVNSRLARALAELRERLPRAGGRDAWLLVLAPLPGALPRALPTDPATAPVAFFGAIAMKIVLSSVLVAASVTAGIVLWLSRATEPRSAASAALQPEGAPAVLQGGGPAAAAGEDTRAPLDRTPVAAAAPATAPATGSAARTIRGRVLDAAGHAVAGIALATSPGKADATCTSGAGGWFEIALDDRAETVVAADPRYATVLAGSARVHGETQPTVVVAPRIGVAGVVLDEARAPLADAALELRLPAGFGAAWGFALDFSVPQHWRASSRADGRFELQLPAVEGAAIQAELAGFEPCTALAPLLPTAALEIVLLRPRASPSLVRGIVLDPAGARAEGARVAAGAEIAMTNAFGEFALDVRSAAAGARLVALKPGLLPAFFEPAKDALGRPQWPAEELVLQLGGPAPTLRGRVVDADGRPVAGARVWLDDPTPFGRTAEARLVAESLLRGDERFWSWELTRADGTFTIAGLLQRPYRLQAVDPRSLASAESAPVTAQDAPVELRLPTRDVHELVAGRIVTATGQPIRGVAVTLFRITYELQHEDGTDNDSVESEPVVTGADGAFAFRNVPRRGVDLMATGDTIFGASACLEQEPDPRRVEIVASLRLHLQVEVGAPVDRADRLRVFDAGGKRVLLSVFHGRGSHASFELPILDGRSAVMSVDERAANLVLYRGEQEVARIPLHLAPGATNVVRY